MSTANSDQFHQLTSDIDVLLERIKVIHEDEMLHRYDLRNNCIDKLRYEEEQNRLLQQRAALAKKYGVEELGARIQEVLQELEDINTRRLSLRIQLSQLIKERSLLLRRCSLEWCVCCQSCYDMPIVGEECVAPTIAKESVFRHLIDNKHAIHY